MLTDTIAQAIAQLSFDSLEGIWLYSRKLGEIKPDWQIFVESTTQLNQDNMDTFGNSPTSSEEVNFPEFKGVFEEDSAGDTGLLQDTGLIHGKPLEEEEINTFVAKKTVEPDAAELEAKATDNGLAQYCFVTNKKILTGDILCPEKDVIRLIRFFHHLSENNQQRILPFVDEHFKKGKTSDTEKLPLVITKWLKQIVELDDKNSKAIAIWLSRYCFDSSTTITELKTMEDKQVELQAAAKKAKRSIKQNDFAAATQTPLKKKQSDDLIEDKLTLPPLVGKLIIPLVWTLATVILICLGIYNNQSEIHSTSGKVPELCQTTIGSPSYCRLGVNLVGKDAIEQSSKGIFPLTEITETVATFGCERFANVKAGLFDNLDPKQSPVISSYGEKIFPNIYVVEAVQKDISQPKNIRVGCVYTTGQGRRAIA